MSKQLVLNLVGLLNQTFLHGLYGEQLRYPPFQRKSDVERIRVRTLGAYGAAHESRKPVSTHRSSRSWRIHSRSFVALARALIERTNVEVSRRHSIASAVQRPCFKAFLLAFGGPGDIPPCIRQRPFVIAGDWQGVPARVRARQRGLKCMGSSGFAQSPPPGPSPAGAPTTPTTACPPAWTWTCSTVTLCWPLPRWRLRASRRAA